MTDQNQMKILLHGNWNLLMNLGNSYLETCFIPCDILVQHNWSFVHDSMHRLLFHEPVFQGHEHFQHILEANHLEKKLQNQYQPDALQGHDRGMMRVRTGKYLFFDPAL